MVKADTRMVAVPTMMVLYTNDAVDVHYSDGSLLQLSACGSSMFHQDPPSDLPKHPLAGVQGVQKWTQFVTSAHKTKVLQAVDFRNRFACRPFLCPTLMAPEDIVSLYARIDQIAWGRTVEECHIEVFEDGSRRAVSRDEFASLVLSPHGQDFTVCYLSHISPDAVSTSSSVHHTSSHEHGVSFSSNPDCFSKPEDDDCGKGEDTGLVESELAALDTTPGAGCEAAQNPDAYPQSNKAALNRNCNNSTPVNNIPLSEDTTVNASGVILSDGTVSTPGRAAQHSDLQSSAFSVQHDISSISRVSSPDGLRGMVDCDDTLTLNEDTAVKPPPPPLTDVLHSSPLSLANTQSCTGHRDTVSSVGANKARMEAEAVAQSSLSNSRHATAQVLRVAPVGRDEEHASSHVKEDNKGTSSTQSTKSVCAEKADKTQVSCEDPARERAPALQQSSTSNQKPVHTPQAYRGERKCSVSSRNRAPPLPLAGSQDRHSGGGGEGGESWSGSRHHYTWVTQHISCNSCPPTWRHPLRLLQQVDPTDSVLTSQCNLTVSTNVAKGLQKLGGGVASAADGSRCVLSSLASPVPLTCPFQHLHQWQSGAREGEGEGDPHLSGDPVSQFRQGQLKVLLMEGVVYRFVDVANMKIVEIYPGDGSVLISQGTTAHFFSHLMWKDGKLEEKSYSVKMLPPKAPSGLYSVQNLIRRAHRLLTGCIHNSKLAQREEDLPCWKRAVTQVVEPLSASLLEESTVPGYGRFQAYSNGRVRVVFEDRTALDMVADFSRRLQGCMKHSSSLSELSMDEKLAALKLTSNDRQPQSSQCRLLLPSGKYVMVEVYKPGQYRRYVDAAKEWIQWVQSSPKERRQFYHDKATPHSARVSAEAELKKIECFNYIVDHSAITASAVPVVTSASLASHPRPLPTSLGSPTHTAAYSSFSAHPVSLVPPADFFQPPASRQSVPHRSYRLGHATAVGVASHGISADSSVSTSGPKDLDMLHGFNSVREALLRTSQMIREIDDIVKDCKDGGSGHSH
ncbi:uncharacterized protein LOC143289122 isoform X1 [Babylonia areolata]|uniref:uncharacterized protein LOC143289122 isoform X1 n=1 Tax=Babylonia areolata TaxID=304850 RepID=UPI003FD11740